MVIWCEGVDASVCYLGLSNNQISELGREAFKSLQLLHTLLLDHNLLTSQVLQGGALTNLTQLKVLALGHNLISMVCTVILCLSFFYSICGEIRKIRPISEKGLCFKIAEKNY